MELPRFITGRNKELSIVILVRARHVHTVEAEVVNILIVAPASVRTPSL